MRALGLSLLAVCMFGLSPANAELPFKVTEAHKALNAAAKKLDVTERFKVEKKCQSDVQTVCRYISETAPVAILVTADNETSNAKSITVIFIPTGDMSDAAAALTTWGVVMNTAQPNLSKSDRGDLFRSLMPAIENKSSESTTNGRVEYSLTNSDVIGIWFNASEVED